MHRSLTRLFIAVALIALYSASVSADSVAAVADPKKKAAGATSGNAAGKQNAASAAATTKQKLFRFSSWAPRWLPNVHTMSSLACRSIQDFRDRSPIVRALVDFSNSSERDAAVTTESASKKLRRAVSSVGTSSGGAGGNNDEELHDPPTSTLVKALGYDYTKLNGFGNSGSATDSHVHAPPSSKPRLLCLGFSHIDNDKVEETALGAMYTAWAKRCDQTLLYTRKHSIPGVPAANTREIHPIQGDGANNIWQKIRLALSMLADPTQDGKILQSVDYVLIFTDDTYLSVQNAKAMLMEPYYVAANRAGALLLLGHRMNDNNNIFVSNLGYFMNRQMIRVLADLVNTPACDPMAVTGSDDIQLGKCATAYGITPFDTYDEVGDDRMLMWEPEMLAYSVKNGFPDWYIRYRARPVLKTLRIVSQNALAFHGVTGMEKINRVNDLLG